jgi:membrane-bound lytic murein transglycosylase A
LPALLAARFTDLPGWRADATVEALPALRQSCAQLASRPLWSPACAALSRLSPQSDPETVRAVLEQHFQPWRVRNPDASTTGLITGYYEPLIQGARHPKGPHSVPIHGLPSDMVVVELADQYPEIQTLRLRGRLEGNRLVPYWSRAQIDTLGPRLPAPILAWADDPIEFFFLQIQGSGRVSLPDGTLMRIGYADQNGHPYRSIGRWLIDQGELKPHEASMQGIQAWARANPQRLRALLHQNPSYVFFRELPPSDLGPIGALGVPLTTERSVAVDPSVIPLGAPVYLSTTWPLSDRPLNRLMVAQDTGGAIKGAVRADFFWGFGAQAGAQAGRMRQSGQLWVLMPKGFSPSTR